jgi:hypothetical protein
MLSIKSIANYSNTTANRANTTQIYPTNYGRFYTALFTRVVV